MPIEPDRLKLLLGIYFVTLVVNTIKTIVSATGNIGVFISVKERYPTVDDCDWFFCDVQKIHLVKDKTYQTSKFLYFSICSSEDQRVFLRAEFHGYEPEAIKKALNDRKKSEDVFVKNQHLKYRREETEKEGSNNMKRGKKISLMWKNAGVNKNFLTINRKLNPNYSETKANKIVVFGVGLHNPRKSMKGKRKK